MDWGGFSFSTLTTIALPSSLTSIDESAFFACTDLQEVHYAGSQSDWAQVKVADGNEWLDDATWHFNSNTCFLHQYDNACDPDCNNCDWVRIPSEHRYEANWDIDCDECGAVRVHSEHLYDDSWDEDCNLCDATRKVVRITKQPQSLCVGEGDNALVMFTASGDGLTYKWYWAKPGSNKFYLTPTFEINGYAVTMNAERDNRRIYCAGPMI